MRKLLISLLLLSTLFTLSAQERAVQFSFITPIGTNGLNSHKVTNKFSLNLVGGYSAANTILEIGGVYNVNLKSTKGVQIAGVMNYSGNSSKALQIAGVLNIAKEVSGVQIGLINISDSCAGVPIGLINIVKHGGKHEFEIAFAETLNTAVSFKLGTNHFYTIFSGGVNFLNSTPEYAAGIGFGTDIKFRDKSWGNQIEVISYGITTNGKFAQGLNMLTQLKYSVSKEFTPHFKVFAGPTINLTISDDCKSESIAPWSMYSSNNGTTALNGWVGLSAGVRF